MFWKLYISEYTSMWEPFLNQIIHRFLDRLYTDVCRRQIPTYKDGPRTERIKIFLAVVDP